MLNLTSTPPIAPRFRIDDRGRVLADLVVALGSMLGIARRCDYHGASVIAAQSLADGVALVAAIDPATGPANRRLRYRGAMGRAGDALAKLDLLHRSGHLGEDEYLRLSGALSRLLQLLGHLGTELVQSESYRLTCPAPALR